MANGLTFTVIIPTRGRPRGLAAAITSLDTLSSGKHNIRYGVCHDDDDPVTGVMCRWIGKDIPLYVRTGERPESLGGLVSEVANHMRADVYVALADDIICLTKNWDDIIAQAVEKTPHGVFWWKAVNEQDPYYAIVTEKWREASGRIFTSDYPYWFDDLCLLELWVMTTLAEPIQLNNLNLAERASHTIRMRELPFWQQFFTFTRKHRVEEGIKIAERLGLPIPENAELIKDKLDEVVKAVPREWLEKIENDQGEKSEPDESYKKAKAKAESIMNASTS